MASPSSDEDLLGSLGISLDEVDLMADADTHASMTGIFAQTWAFEYFPFTRPELLQTDPGLGLAPLAWRWYKSNLHPVRIKKSLKELRAFFDTCPLEQGIPHVEFLMGGDYDEFCGISLMPPIGPRFDDFQGPVPSRPLGTRSSRASGPSTRTPRRRPRTDPTSSTPTARPSQAGPSRLIGPFRAPRAILGLPGRFTQTLPVYAFHTVPVGLINQMMELFLGMQQELAAAWT
ncbi:hypothetical protein JCGZ_19386 [Jatropha curcas]|uniref:Aminotransferase-like plant mobile domain-containing protein n=1 Tax=Jatropha curcas TaxID=180498 RepID=A0A067K0A4_JATCU|nr:hypothetical protein JCGZ_19386 [Jatropha curcas]